LKVCDPIKTQVVEVPSIPAMMSLNGNITTLLCVLPERGIEETGRFTVRFRHPVVADNVRPEVNDVPIMESEAYTPGHQYVGT
jgi:hypothetical protein